MAFFNAMDVWQIACYLTVFSSVIEFCFVIYLTKTATWEEGITVAKKKVDVFNKKLADKVKESFLIL